MKLFHSHTSPFVRKVMVVAHELGLADRIALLPCSVHPIARDQAILAQHPLAQAPTLIDADGNAIADSRVICEYLDATAGHRLFPPEGPARWRALNEQSAADGLLDAALLIRYEQTARPDGERSQSWIVAQQAKIDSTLAWFEDQIDGAEEPVDIGRIALGCALGYLDLRFATLDWRGRFPALAGWFAPFSARPSMVATRPPAG